MICSSHTKISSSQQKKSITKKTTQQKRSITKTTQQKKSITKKTTQQKKSITKKTTQQKKSITKETTQQKNKRVTDHKKIVGPKQGVVSRKTGTKGDHLDVHNHHHHDGRLDIHDHYHHHGRLDVHHHIYHQPREVVIKYESKEKYYPDLKEVPTTVTKTVKTTWTMEDTASKVSHQFMPSVSHEPQWYEYNQYNPYNYDSDDGGYY